ncbi:MAG: histidine decarboxylase [Chlamydiales bacterium]|nr:histidine decarboxylase [Chlamydiales bacterium]
MRTGIKELDRLYAEFQKAAKKMVGYPIHQAFDYSKLFHFLQFHINNLGDPFLDSWHYKINTLKIEKEVIDHVAKLFHAPKDNYWGYVTNGGTEGNLYGLYVARELHPEGVVFYSDQTHYSVPKNLRLLRMRGVKVKSQPNGEVDYQALQHAIIHEEKTPIILANIGTTMRGAVDDVAKIKEILSDLNIEKYYIHCDAAFFGMILPFISELESQFFDFRLGIDSMAISGHKMIGTPMPCGIVLVNKTHVDQVGSYIEYTGSKDNTISGSRNGLTPLFLWYELNYNKRGNLVEVTKDCLKRAGYALKKFNDAGIEAWRNKNSIIVVFPRPSDKIIKKWQLAVEGDIAHMITLPHLSYKVIDQVVAQVVSDLKTNSNKKQTRKKRPTHSS